MNAERHVLMLIESSRESGRQLIAGIADYARHMGPWNFHWKTQGLGNMVPGLGDVAFDGALVRDVAAVPELVDAGIPVVAFTYSKEEAKGIGWVNTDDRSVSEMVANHFLERGFQHFAYCGFKDFPWSLRRRDGFSETLKEAGHEANCHLLNVDGGDDDVLSGWLNSLPKPVALMAANDELGQRILRVCYAHGIRVPTDCAVVGVDNDPVICGLSNPPLSSVGMDQYQSGYFSAAMLDTMMRGETPEKMTVTAQVGALALRQSSDMIAVDDVAVAKALRFIQENAYRPMKVDEVALASGLFRRGLERRFRQHLSRTIQQYCREARANHIAKILRESWLSLEVIAAQCGFPESSHLTRFFVSVYGETPSNYRKRVSVR